MDYVAQYLQRVTTLNDCEAPDIAQVNGSRDLLLELHRANHLSGANTARDLWQRLKANYPDLQNLIPVQQRRIYGLTDLQKLPPVRWLVPALIPERGFSVMYGQPESTKSFAALHYALKTAIEHPVIYIAGEGISGYGQRTKAWVKHHGVDPAKLKFMLDIDALNMLSRADCASFVEQVKSIKPRLLVLDTLARCMVGGDENSARDMGAFCDSVKYLIDTLDTAVLVLHHTPKSGGLERGSGALRGAADSMIAVSYVDGITTLAQDKLKDAARSKPISLMLMPVEETESCVLVPASEAPITIKNQLPQSEQSILRAMALSIHVKGIRLTSLKSHVNLNENTLYKALSRLKNKGLIEQPGKYDPYELTAEGWRAIRLYKLEDGEYS